MSADEHPLRYGARELARHAICCVVMFGALTLLAMHSRLPSGLKEVRAKYEAGQPEVVFLGNSMVGRNVDADQFSAATGVKAWKLYRNGSASALWYLTIKNVIANSERPPQTVVLFFRDHFLTDPTFRTMGRNATRIHAMSQAAEPEVDRLVYRPALGGWRYWGFKHWPLYRRRGELKSRLDELVQGAIADATGGRKLDVELAVESVFAPRNMSRRQLTLAQQDPLGTFDEVLFDFPQQVERSLLPQMIDELHQRGINLVCVRVKRRRDTTDAQPERLQRYMTDLRAYLAARNVPLLDFTEDTTLDLAHYADGDHLNADGRAHFTDLLAKQFQECIDPQRIARRK